MCQCLAIGRSVQSFLERGECKKQIFSLRVRFVGCQKRKRKKEGLHSQRGAIALIGRSHDLLCLMMVIRHLLWWQWLLRWCLQQQRVTVLVMIGLLVRDWVRVKIMIRDKVRVGVTFNITVYHWSNCRRSKCHTFVVIATNHCMTNCASKVLINLKYVWVYWTFNKKHSNTFILHEWYVK